MSSGVSNRQKMKPDALQGFDLLCSHIVQSIPTVIEKTRPACSLRSKGSVAFNTCVRIQSKSETVPTNRNNFFEAGEYPPISPSTRSVDICGECLGQKLDTTDVSTSSHRVQDHLEPSHRASCVRPEERKNDCRTQEQLKETRVRLQSCQSRE